ncbi:Protein kinase domain-containing protein [Plasmodiophora brassicae]
MMLYAGMLASLMAIASATVTTDRNCTTGAVDERRWIDVWHGVQGRRLADSASGVKGHVPDHHIRSEGIARADELPSSIAVADLSVVPDVEGDNPEQGDKWEVYLRYLLLRDRYQITGLLGNGGYGRIYQAINLHSGTRVAIKVVRKDQTTPDLYLEFALHCIVDRHCNIVNVHDFVDMPALSYIVMEEAEGDLFDLVAAHGRPLAEDHARSLFIQLLDAVEICHRAGIVHHDIKPENVLLTCDRTHVLLSDFGHAEGGFRPGHLWTTSPYGTDTYNAPEKYSGQDYRGDLSDVWSLGCVLYIMLAAYEPFASGACVRTGDYPPLPDHVSDQARHLVDWILTHAADRRPTIDQIREHDWITGRYVHGAPRRTLRHRWK